MNASSLLRMAACAAAVAGGLAPLHASGPGSDTFATARVISSSRDTSDPTNITNYTTEAGESVYGSPGAMGKTAWWKWTASEDGFCTVDTKQTLYAANPLRDTMLAVYTGTAVNNLNPIGTGNYSSDYGAEWLHASVSFYAIKGNTYHFAADIWGGNPPTATAYNIVLELRHIPRRASMRHTNWNAAFSELNMGTLTMNLTATGSYSAKLVIFKTAYAVKGIIGVDGQGSFSVQPKGPPGAVIAPVTVEFDLAGPGRFQVYSNQHISSNYSFPERQTFTGPNPMAAYYTAYISSVFQPNGFLSFTVKPNGTVIGRGCNLDGAAFTFSTYLYHNPSAPIYYMPVYAVTAGGKSVFSMRSRLISVNGNYRVQEDIALSVRAPATKPTDVFYNAGFSTDCNVFGAVYSKPVGRQRPMNYLAATNGYAEIRLPDFMGTYGGDISEYLTWSDTNKLTFSSKLRKPALTINPTTGLLTGSILIPPGNKKQIIKGILAINDGLQHVRGFITGPTRNLRFSLHSAVPPPAP